jgi:hypothetical protein
MDSSDEQAVAQPGLLGEIAGSQHCFIFPESVNFNIIC